MVRAVSRTDERFVVDLQKDLAGRIALSIFTHSAFNLDTGILSNDVSVQTSDEMRDALQILNLISARQATLSLAHVT